MSWIKFNVLQQLLPAWHLGAVSGSEYLKVRSKLHVMSLPDYVLGVSLFQKGAAADRDMYS